MIANDSDDDQDTQARFLELQRRAASRAPSRPPGFRLGRKLIPASSPEMQEDIATMKARRSRRPQPLRSCFKAARPTLATFDVDWLAKLCLAARNMDDVHAIFQLIHDGVGSHASAIVNVGPTRLQPIFEILIDAPDALVDEIRSRRVIDDPMMVACEQRVLGFAASDLDRIIEMNDRRRETMAIYARYGHEEGFTVPCCVPGDARGFCTYGWTNPEDLTMDVMMILNTASMMLFETARRVLGLWVERPVQVELTPRQIDCLAGSARGLHDAQIAWELGISVPTVQGHFESARRRYGARKRMDLMVCAIRSGDLHWDRITERGLRER